MQMVKNHASEDHKLMITFLAFILQQIMFVHFIITTISTSQLMLCYSSRCPCITNVQFVSNIVLFMVVYICISVHFSQSVNILHHLDVLSVFKL